jgi:enterochelin esterase-like enzyme
VAISRRQLLFSVAAAGGALRMKRIELKGEIDRRAGAAGLEVWLPERYGEGGAKHPLIIALHGWNNSPELWRQNGGLSALADQHRCVVAVPSMGKSVYETRFYPETKSSWTAGPGTRWVGEVVLPYLRANFAVHGDRRRTAVIGYSTGGRGAVLVAEAYPSEVSFAGSVSGTYDLMRLDPSEGEYKIHAAMYGPREKFKERWELDNCIAPARLAQLGEVRLFIRHGDKDPVVKPDQLEALQRALEGRAVSADLALVEGAGHDWVLWNSQWPPLFAAAAQGWS